MGSAIINIKVVEMALERNDIGSLLAAGIPARTEKFTCGWWGKHQPPRVDEETGEIVFAVGEGYRSNRHLHGQNFYVLDVDFDGGRVALVEMRKYGDLYGAGLWHYLVGVDGAPFVAQVPKTVDTLEEALEYLKPAEVKRAEAQGKEVKRQGDWFFVPVKKPHPTAADVPPGTPLDDDHVPEEMKRTPGGTVYVRGKVRHAQHDTIVLEGWHKAVRNKAIRTGRLALGGDAD